MSSRVIGGAAITVFGLSHAFRSAERASVALQDISFTVSGGEFVCLLGPSGCGKSTLLTLIAGFLRPSRGRRERDELCRVPSRV